MDRLPHAVLHVIKERGLDGDGMTVAEAAALRSDIADYADQLASFGLGDLVDVTGTPEDGDTLVYNEDEDEWQVGSVSGTIARIDDFQNNQVGAEVSRLTANEGLTAEGISPGRARIYVRFAGSGTANSVARSDHRHNHHNITRAEFAPTGYLSSGTRQLVNTSVVIPEGIRYLVKATLKVQMRGADQGPCYYRMGVSVNTIERVSPGGQNGFWCVQGVPNKDIWSHREAFVGTGAAVPIRAYVSYDGGGGSNVDAGEVEIELHPSS